MSKGLGKGDVPSHQWETSNKSSGMKIDDNIIDDKLLHMPQVIDPMEAERYVEGLEKFDLEQVGSSKWMEQHRRVEKLNLQAHQNAMINSDEYVLEAILTFNKLEVLIHDLLLIEAWKENVYPYLLDKVAGRNTMRIYFILYHEATIINLFELLLYHKHICEAGAERILELVDYIARKLTRINSGYDFRQIEMYDKSAIATGSDGARVKEYTSYIANRTPRDELVQYLTEIEFKVCISSCSIARFICEHCDILPLSVITRITDIHDFLILIIPLIENPPWTRRLDNGRWQKLIDHKWTDVNPIDLLKITKYEGQPWLTVYHLLAKSEFRERYSLNSYRKGQLLRVRKYINDTLLDQLPILADIQRYMDELALTEVPEPHESNNSVFLFQQVAIMRESIIKKKDFEQVASFQMTNIFTMTDKDDKDVRALADLWSDDLTENVLDPDAYIEKISAHTA